MNKNICTGSAKTDTAQLKHIFQHNLIYSHIVFTMLGLYSEVKKISEPASSFTVYKTAITSLKEKSESFSCIGKRLHIRRVALLLVLKSDTSLVKHLSSMLGQEAKHLYKYFTIFS